VALWEVRGISEDGDEKPMHQAASNTNFSIRPGTDIGRDAVSVGV
jgi:hypothetical protein